MPSITGFTGVAQLVEQRSPKPRVGGSSPPTCAMRVAPAGSRTSPARGWRERRWSSSGLGLLPRRETTPVRIRSSTPQFICPPWWRASSFPEVADDPRAAAEEQRDPAQRPPARPGADIRPPARPGTPRSLGISTSGAKRFWRTWATSPQSATWAGTDWAELEITTRLVDALYQGDLRHAGEVRQRTAKWGATTEDRARLRMSINDDQDQEQAEDADQAPADLDEELFKLLSEEQQNN